MKIVDLETEAVAHCLRDTEDQESGALIQSKNEVSVSFLKH